MTITDDYVTITFQYKLDGPEHWHDKYSHDVVTLTSATVTILRSEAEEDDVKVALYGQPLKKNGQPHSTRRQTRIFNDNALAEVLAHHAKVCAA
jgi:hypothetical protein